MLLAYRFCARCQARLGLLRYLSEETEGWWCEECGKHYKLHHTLSMPVTRLAFPDHERVGFVVRDPAITCAVPLTPQEAGGWEIKDPVGSYGTFWDYNPIAAVEQELPSLCPPELPEEPCYENCIFA